MTTVGYGDISPTNTVERLFVIALMIFGVFTFSMVTGMLASVLTSADEVEVEKTKYKNLLS